MKTQLSNEIKSLIQMNVSCEDFKSLPGEFTEINGKYGYSINWDKVSKYHIDIAEKNVQIINELAEKRKNRTDILVGDFLEMPDGSVSRVTYCWEDTVQDGGGSGSFYLCSHGDASYSGSLDSGKPKGKIKFTDRTQKALFWIFSQGWSGGGRGFYFYINVKVWKIEELLKTAYVKFKDHKLNYHTSVNGKLSNEEIKRSFEGKWFNLGTDEKENLQRCTECCVYY